MASASKEEVLAARILVSERLKRKKVALVRLIEAHPEEIDAARMQLTQYAPGLHKDRWGDFLNLPMQAMKAALEAEKINGCHWQTLMQFSPFMFKETWAKFLEEEDREKTI